MSVKLMAVSMVDMRDFVGFLPLISLLAVNGMKLTYGFRAQLNDLGPACLMHVFCA